MSQRKLKSGKLMAGAIVADGLDEAAIGVLFDPKRVIYDAEEVVRVLVERDGMTREDAIEYAQFNVFASDVGEGSPVFVCVEVTDMAKVQAMAILNAARIAMELPARRKFKTFDLPDVIAHAAKSMALMECADGFDWATAPLDWESFCNALAQIIAAGRRATVADVLKTLR